MKMKPNQLLIKPFILAAAGLFLTPQSNAAVMITQSVVADTGVDVDLTSEGTLDWKSYNESTVFEKDGASFIGTLSTTGATITSWDGVQNNTWTDGLAPDGVGSSDATIELQDPGLVSMSFDVTGLAAGDYQLQFYGSSFRANYAFTATLSGGDTQTATGGANGAIARLFTVDFTATAGETLTVTYAQTADNGTNFDNIGLSAVTLTAVPEPSSTALLGLGGLALILRRRK